MLSKKFVIALMHGRKKYLTRAGKEVLLKTVAQAMSIFTMSIFLLPINICDSIEKLMNRYWWDKNTSGSNSIHWLSWARMAVPKQCGGLVFKRLREFNVALLAKQGWRILTNPLSLVSRLMKARYFPTSSFLDAKLGNNPSYLWRSILAGQDILREGVARRVGDGKDTLVWGCPWLADREDPYVRTKCSPQLREARVCNLLDNSGNCDVELLRDIFYSHGVDRIRRTPISPSFVVCW